MNAQTNFDFRDGARRPKVSVLVITYNHEKFIGQTLEGILLQTTNFPYEVVIGEDCSTDGTSDVLQDYQRHHPETLRVLFRPTNLGANRNFVQTLKECRGEYVALVDGDDYWTDPQKLQKQVDYLDTHLNCSTCFHAITPVDEHGIPINDHRMDPPGKEVSSIEDILKRNFMYTCAVMFRAGLVGHFPEWFYTLKLGDWPLHIFNARRGDIGYLPEMMAAYRIHAGGMWSSISRVEQLRESIKMLGFIDAHLEFRYSGIVKQAASVYLTDLACTYAENGQWTRSLYYAGAALTRSPFTDLSWKLSCIKRIIALRIRSVRDHA